MYHKYNKMWHISLCINCWTLSIFNYLKFVPIAFYYKRTLLSHMNNCTQVLAHTEPRLMNTAYLWDSRTLRDFRKQKLDFWSVYISFRLYVIVIPFQSATFLNMIFIYNGNIQNINHILSHKLVQYHENSWNYTLLPTWSPHRQYPIVYIW